MSTRSFTRRVLAAGAATVVFLPTPAFASHGDSKEPVVPATWETAHDGATGADEVALFAAGSAEGNVNNPDSLYVTGTATKPQWMQALGINDLDVVTTAFDADTGAVRWSKTFDDGGAVDRAAGMEVDGNDILLYVVSQSGTNAVTNKLNMRNGDIVKTYRYPSVTVNDTARSVTTSHLTLVGSSSGQFAVLDYETAGASPDTPTLDDRPVTGEAFGADIHHTWTGDIPSWRTIVVTGRESGFNNLGDAYTVAYRTDTKQKVWEQRWTSDGNRKDEGQVALSHYVRELGHGLSFVAGRTLTPDHGWDIFVGAYDLETGAPVWSGPGGLRFFDGDGLDDDEPVAMAYSDETQTLYVTGTSERGFPHGVDVVTLAFDALTGERRGIAHAAGDISNGDDSPASITVSADGQRVFVAAEVHNLLGTGGYRSAVFGYDAALRPAGSAYLSAGGSGVDQAAGVAMGIDDIDDEAAEPHVLLGGSTDPGATRTDLAAAAFPVSGFAVQPVATDLRFTDASATTGQHTDAATLQVALTEGQGTPVPGASVDLSFGGDSYSAVTDANGVATVEVTLDDLPGPVAADVSFAGDDLRLPSSASTTFTITREDSHLDISVTGKGAGRTITASLTDADDPNSPISGRTLTFFANGVEVGQAVTGSDGKASIAAPPGSRGGSNTYGVRFDGDAAFLGSEAVTST